MSPPIDFYFDFWSPYGYLASTRIDEIAARHGRPVRWIPFMLGAAFKVSNLAPLLDIPLVGPYSAHDFQRSARLHDIPFTMPPDFPKAALAPSRAYYWIADSHPEVAIPFAKAVYHATFGEGRDTTEPELVAALAEPFGIRRDALLEAIQQPAVKERLKQETERALERGVCGSPYVIVDGEPFWGNDRLDQVDRWLETGGW